jgi:putative membrane protein
MRSRLILLSTIAVALSFGVPALAQQRPAPGTPTSAATTLSRADLDFVKKAAEGGMAEVALGKLAQQNAESPQVKQFGAKMEQDHGAANAQLTAIATGKGATMPQSLDQKDMRAQERLSKLHGAAFDREYMRMMVEDHDKDLKEFQKAAQSKHDQEIRNFAQQTASVVQEHDQLAHQVVQSLSATGSSRQPR